MCVRPRARELTHTIKDRAHARRFLTGQLNPVEDDPVEGIVRHLDRRGRREYVESQRQ